MTVSVDLSVESPLWSAVPDLETLTEQAIAAAIAESRAELPPACEVSFLFCDDAAIQALNARWRGIDKPTNVLSFPADGPETPGALSLLGDIVMAYETVAVEASRDRTTIEAHVSHLAIHGFLHLIGYDHMEEAEAGEMEALESRSMIRLGRPDPWLGRAEVEASLRVADAS